MARLDRLTQIDADAFFTPDPVLRLAALLPNNAVQVEALARKLRLSNAVSERLVDLAGAHEKVVSYLSVKEMRKLTYRLGAARFKDRVFLRWAEDLKESNAVQWRALIPMAESFPRPKFPLTGRDVMLAGVPEGPLVGEILAEVEEWWIDADFTDDEFSIAERLKAVVQGKKPD
jgi:poly(A) polymerase